ncbi:hypothetical protein J2W32_000973 [Variovorax boronicumulans]|uniref:Transposase n=1 Tax=Variovorax boronicumulans TaxID=436515 RepID=A0AAW8CVM2_9BURK|nr:hypothetical protein [Variovorax boronicumulans]MDP9892583.1 hypothetical protein [Variovorax boronicumulans]MDQ0051937.1 hypothetical protein [Variovorax boronicumulans]
MTAAASTFIAGQGAERPLMVRIRPHRMECWEYEGTRAQLEAESVIPASTRWPEGAGVQTFEVGRYRYQLCRTRPEGMKGPKKLWSTGDWWSLRCELIDGPDQATLRILEKQRALAAEIYLQSPAGQREWEARWNRQWKAQKDKAFQAFTSTLFPQQKKPSRNPKSGLPQGVQMVGGRDNA